MSRSAWWSARGRRALQCAALVVAAGCSSNGMTTSSGGNTVTALATLAFAPKSITVPVGSSVTWVFQSVGHTVTFTAAQGAPADIGSVDAPQANTSVSRTFATVGTYTYHCSIHPEMTGTVIVSQY